MFVSYAPLRKVAETKSDGTLKIAGVASSESVDEMGEIVKADAMKAALVDFFKHGTGALREMHQLSAAGTVDSAETEANGVTRITATVVDENAIRKIRTGTYKGLSIGGRVLARDPKNRKIITKLSVDEVSLVDRPCNPDAVLTMKAAGAHAATSEAVEAAFASMSGEQKALALIRAVHRFGGIEHLAHSK